MEQIVYALNDLLWSWLLVPMLLSVGLFFTIRTGALQVRRLPALFATLAGSTRDRREQSISPFKALATSLGSKVGTGNIIGVAVALALGGPGAVFWMWVVAFVGMATAMVEATLAQVYKRRDAVDGKNVFRGGPAYYLAGGLNMRWLGVVFSLMLVFGGFAFAMLQASSMASALEGTFSISPLVTGFIAATIFGMVIAGGIRRIATFAELVVPFMALAYVAVALIVVLLHLPQVPALIGNIVTSAFGIQQGAAGFTGWAVSQALLNGVRRGMYSNDAGAGSAPNFAATADVDHPGNQGYIQAVGVFLDTMVICTCTALIVMLAGGVLDGPIDSPDGAAMVSAAMSQHVGAWGAGFVAMALCLFAFTSALGNFYQGENGLLFIRGNHRWGPAFKAALIASLFVGAQLQQSLAWDMADVAQGLMACVNCYALVRLSSVAVSVIKDYDQRRRAGGEMVFDPETVTIRGELHPGVWDERPSDAITK